MSGGHRCKATAPTEAAAETLSSVARLGDISVCRSQIVSLRLVPRHLPLGKGGFEDRTRKAWEAGAVAKASPPQTPICLLKSKQAWQKPYFRAFAKLVSFIFA